MKEWTNVFLFDTFNPINGGWVFYTGDTGGSMV